nr:hypothetical protein [Bacillus mycoides]
MTAMQKEKLYGKEHARLERQYFYKHVSIFILAQLLFIFVIGLVPHRYQAKLMQSQF